MKVADLLEARRKNWEELDRLCAQMETSTRRSMGPLAVSRFAALYRAACADLALAVLGCFPDLRICSRISRHVA